MERVSLKRMRSDESPVIIQSKTYVNEKIVNAHDANKMKEIHDRTTKLLFQAARSKHGDNTENNTKIPLSKLVILLGNGVTELARDTDYLDEEFMFIKRKSECCQRETYVQSDCTNCQKPLCEECGYSCQECGNFICNSCVTVFGCGNPDRPMCEKCLLFA